VSDSGPAVGMVRLSAGPRLVPDNPWLLPSDLTVADGAPVRRSTRDWIVDGAGFLISLIYVVVAATDHVHDAAAARPVWLMPADLLVGLLASLTLWVRRRRPVALSAALIVLSAVSPTVFAAEVMVLLTATVHRRLPVAVALITAFVGAGAVLGLVRPDAGMGAGSSTLLNLIFGVSLLAWGMFIRARRQLMLSLRDRAHRAESEQRVRMEQARERERTRIAQEMHDVLAHRMSLLSLHAGALEFRPDAPAEQIARAAGVIRDNAHTALEELREVIGVLREADTDTEETPQRPQPTLADLPTLIAEVRQAGMRVELRLRAGEPAGVSAAIGRTVYRIVQEGLTNARKHAPGAQVRVTVAGMPADGVTVEIRNHRPVGSPSPIPGAGLGLIGLAERVDLIHGRLEYGTAPDGDFHLRAWLPWSA
jgi:signal transduction histidine kinase